MMDIREQYAYLKPQPIVWLAILGSAGLHLGLVGLLVLGGWMREHSTTLRDKAIITRLVKKGVKKHESILPVKDVKPPAPAPAPKPAVVPPKPDSKPPDPKPKQPKPKDAQPPRADNSQAMASAMAALQAEDKKTDYQQEGDPEGDPDGDALVKQKGDMYLTQVYKKVKANYQVPELISAKERMFLEAVVILYLDAAGGVRDIKFEKRSGNGLFDSAVEGAIRRAAPYGAPPKELADHYAAAGIGIPFRAAKM